MRFRKGDSKWSTLYSIGNIWKTQGICLNFLLDR